MKLEDYQPLAASTAQVRAYQRAYLVPMIVGEIGELFGKAAKAVWHGPGSEKAESLQQDLMLEYGDVAWGTAILLDMEGVHHISTPTAGESFRTIWGEPLVPFQQLLQRASNLHLMYSQPDTQQYINTCAQRLWVNLEQQCETITGHTWEATLQANLDKLASRAARGVLQGSGDHR